MRDQDNVGCPEERPTRNTSAPIVHDAAGWRAVARTGRVYVTEVERARDPGLTPLEARELALAILEAVADARRGTQPYHERRDYFDDPIWAELVRERQAVKWPAGLTDSDWEDIESEWRARRDG